jgi:hypothetical protein
VGLGGPEYCGYAKAAAPPDGEVAEIGGAEEAPRR